MVGVHVYLKKEGQVIVTCPSVVLKTELAYGCVESTVLVSGSCMVTM